MKKFSISLLVAAFAITCVSAQTQQPVSQKPVVKSESAKKQPAADKNIGVAPAEKKVEPITDGIINVNDEQKYLEQKKQEKEKKNTEQHTDTPK